MKKYVVTIRDAEGKHVATADVVLTSELPTEQEELAHLDGEVLRGIYSLTWTEAK